MGWVVNATPRPIYPRERPGTLCIGRWVGPRASLDGCGKSRLHRDLIPGPSSPSQVIIPTVSYAILRSAHTMYLCVLCRSENKQPLFHYIALTDWFYNRDGMCLLRSRDWIFIYLQFNIQQFYVLPTQCIYVLCVDLRTNSDYFPIQH